MDKKTIVISKNDIDVFASLECGQTFRFYKVKDNEYIVYSLDKKAVVSLNGDNFIISSVDIDYFYNYFALDVDYKKIFNTLMNMPVLKDMLDENTKKLRILKQDPFEMIISFIISANNNIPRIKGIIEKLCTKLGKHMGDYYAFPDAKTLASQNEDFYKSIGLGYRAQYILKTAKLINEGKFNINNIYNLKEEEAKEQLLTLAGVGPKVADCILLFGYNKQNVFPVDTWIEKVYIDIFKKEKSVKHMREDFLNMFKPYPGIAQQYLFFAKRSNN